MSNGLKENVRERPLSIAMLALGGQGGGVLTGWLVETAEANGYVAQSTYVAGVAQRTGATVYCVEMFPRASIDAAGKEPVFTPYPIPGDVDLVIAGEMAETARAIEKGFVTPNVTTMIASSHRVYAMAEKEALGDGIVDLSILADVAGKAAKQFVCFDMQAAADDSGSVISSVILGAVAASGALPFERQAFENTIRQSGRAVEANLRGFSVGFNGVSEPPARSRPVTVDSVQPVGNNGQALSTRIEASLPAPVRSMALTGALRALDYQDVDYASEYLDAVEKVSVKDDSERDYAVTQEVARQLALQMCYEDTIRVADLKTRRSRFERVREQVAAQPDQPVQVVEYFHPRPEEVLDTLPKNLAKLVMRFPLVLKLLRKLFNKGRNITTTNFSGYLMLHVLSRLKCIRRSTLRFDRQQALINDWLERVNASLDSDYDYALSVANCIEIVKGYGDTYERGLSRYRATIQSAENLPPQSRGAAVRRLHRAALADEKGDVFRETIAGLGVNA